VQDSRSVTGNYIAAEARPSIDCGRSGLFYQTWREHMQQTDRRTAICDVINCIAVDRDALHQHSTSKLFVIFQR